MAPSHTQYMLKTSSNNAAQVMQYTQSIRFNQFTQDCDLGCPHYQVRILQDSWMIGPGKKDCRFWPASTIHMLKLQLQLSFLTLFAGLLQGMRRSSARHGRFRRTEWNAWKLLGVQFHFRRVYGRNYSGYYVTIYIYNLMIYIYTNLWRLC